MYNLEPAIGRAEIVVSHHSQDQQVQFTNSLLYIYIILTNCQQATNHQPLIAEVQLAMHSCRIPTVQRCKERLQMLLGRKDRKLEELLA